VGTFFLAGLAGGLSGFSLAAAGGLGFAGFAVWADLAVWAGAFAFFSWDSLDLLAG